MRYLQPFQAKIPWPGTDLQSVAFGDSTFQNLVGFNPTPIPHPFQHLIVIGYGNFPLNPLVGFDNSGLGHVMFSFES
jgi:hypothetical protein